MLMLLNSRGIVSKCLKMWMAEGMAYTGKKIDENFKIEDGFPEDAADSEEAFSADAPGYMNFESARKWRM